MSGKEVLLADSLLYTVCVCVKGLNGSLLS